MDLTTLHDTPPWEWPEDADKMLLGILRDKKADESERLLAAELAGDSTVINDELADALMSILRNGDESGKLRGKAVLSLGPALEQAYIDRFDEPEYVPISEQAFSRIQKTLRKLYMDAKVPKEVRRCILEASVRAPQDWHKNAVRAAYASDDEDWRLTAVFCMRFVGGFENQILQSLESKNPNIHYEAVCAAGNWELEAAWPIISSIITTEENDKPLLLAAIDAAASIHPHEAAGILVDLTESDDEDIVEAAYEAMGMAEALAGEDWGDDDDDDDEFL
jgi:hypothetical protein